MRASLVSTFTVLSLPVHGQVPSNIAYIEPEEAPADAPVTITLELLQGETIDRMYMLYRPYGEG
ncbi:MAG: hypothetical protein KAJ12_08225, partial [Bacteroidetes bacterium]|nr:hypothetical protein [Bacteroidota bacterium]